MTVPTGNGGNGGSGPATDRNNEPVIDPTANVLDLVDAAVTRLDDLRQVETRRIDDLRDSFLKRIEEIAAVRSHYENELRMSESKRIDAVRAVDVAAVAAAASAAETRATALAQQVSASAEAMRNQVAAAAQAASTALTAALEPIQKDVADLRRVQYEQQGQRTEIGDRRLSTSAVVTGEDRSAQIEELRRDRGPNRARHASCSPRSPRNDYGRTKWTARAVLLRR